MLGVDLYPKILLDAKRWMIRAAGKQSISAYETRPVDYDTSDDDIGPNHWRWRWNNPSVLANYDQAKSYWDRHPDQIEGLTFVLHPFGEHEGKTRLICLDFDGAIADGILDSDVLDLVIEIGSYAEYSKSGNGVHVFVLVDDCPAFSNCLVRPVGECKVDVLCSNPVNITGNTLEGFSEIQNIPYSQLEALPFYTYKEPARGNHQKPEWWSEEPIEDVPDNLRDLIPAMEANPAIEGQGGSQVLFAAACRLMRHGVTGREAEALLRCVPAEPEFPPEQIQRTIECAYNQTVHEGEFNNLAPEFDVIDHSPEPDIDNLSEEDREKRYGFHYMSLQELDEANLTLEYLVDKAFVGEGAMFIGGREKTFKTCIAADLLVSLASKTPFLGRFPVLERRRSVLFTAEIGMPRATQLLRAICYARGLSLSQVHGVDIVDSVPSFVSKNDKQAAKILQVKRFLKERKPEIVVFDPLYFSMGGASAGDMYEIGDILRDVTDICKEYKVWPIFCHHAKKDSNKEFDPMDLSDFYGSGVGAFARQWILLSHSEPFRGGVANLYATIGGSSQGSLGTYRVRIDEGQEDEIAKRRWDVTVEESDDSGNGGISKSNILGALEGVGLVNTTELSVHMDCAGQESVIQKKLHALVREGKVSMRNRKFELAMGGF